MVADLNFPSGCNPHLLAAHCTCVHPPTILTPLVANYLWNSPKSDFWHYCTCVHNTMVFFLCLLVSFVGQAIGAGIPEKLENEICKNSKSGICNHRASWGYLASNGPVQDHFVLFDIPDCFPATSGHMANQLWRSSRWVLWWCKPVAHWPRLFNCTFGGPRGNYHGRHSCFLILVKTWSIFLQLLGWVQLGPDWLHLKQRTFACVFISQRSNPLYYGR